MAGWETQGFERGWGGTGRTFLSHYKRLGPLGKHPPKPPARSPGPAALLLSPAAAALCGRRLIPDHHHGWRGMRCPERGSLSPRCSGWRSPHVPGAGGCRQQGHLACGQRSAACVEKEGEGSVLLQGCVLQSRAVLTSLFPRKMGRTAVASCFHLTLAEGHRGLAPASG